MIINNDRDDLQRQNKVLAKISAYLAMNKAKDNQLKMPFEMIDSKSLPEFYSELLSFTPSILADAIH